MPSSSGTTDHDNQQIQQSLPFLITVYFWAAAVSFLFFLWLGFRTYFGPNDWQVSGFEGYFLPLIFLPMVFIRRNRTQPKKGDAPPIKDRVFFCAAFVVVLAVALASPRVPGSDSIPLNVGNSGNFLSIDFALPILVAAFAIGILAMFRNRDHTLAITAIVAASAIVVLLAVYRGIDVLPGGFNSVVVSYQTLVVGPVQMLFGLIAALIFLSITLERTELGKLFISSLTSLFGTLRGGVAKATLMLVVLLGAMTGDPKLVFLWTCAITIPAMRMGGLSRAGAAAIQATACSGALIMPLVTGNGAYYVAEFLDVTYVEVLVSGSLMAMAWVFSLFLGIDGAAARSRNADEKIRELTFRGRSIGRWRGVAVVVLGIVALLFCATKPVLVILLALLLLVANRRITGGADFLPTIKTVTILAVERAISAAPIFFVAGFFWPAISYVFIALVGNEQFMRITFELLDATAVLKGVFLSGIAFLTGWGFPSTGETFLLSMISSFSIFFDDVALIAHFWSVGVFFAFPFATGTILAAAMSGASPLSVFVHALRLGVVILVFPLLAVVNPDLLPRQLGPEVFLVGMAVIAAVFCWSVGAYGYLYGLGDLRRNGRAEWPIRMLFILAALILPLTGSNAFGWPYAELPIGAGCIFLALILASNTGEAANPP
ncbi:MAG: TRAP transporter large permease subunit [Rhodospirillales bacterium]|nr:TRAP transporter large permease subunit [Rhodospirillales bacterium]